MAVALDFVDQAMPVRHPPPLAAPLLRRSHGYCLAT